MTRPWGPLNEDGAQRGEAGDDLFRLLVRSVLDYAIFFLDPRGYVASWNEGAQRIKGYTADEIIGKHFSVFYPQAPVEAGWPDYELKAAEAEGRFEDEGWRIRKDGTRFWADVVITAVRDDAGVLRGFAKVTRDLTERRAALEAVRESEERYRRLVDAVRDYAIFMLDPDGIVMTWNPGAERLKGYTANEIVGKHFSVFYPAERAASGFPAQELETARIDGRFEEENWRVRKDGTMFWANVVLSAVFDNDGTLLGFSKVTRDITDRRHLELAALRLTNELNARVDELAAANRTLAGKNKEVETFVYGVSHDVRGPLVNLQGFNRELQRSCGELLQTLDSSSGIPDDLRSELRRIVAEEMAESTGFMHTAVLHLSNIIDALLQLARIGRVAYECREVKVADTVERVLKSLQGTINARKAAIEVMDLPPVWADSTAIEQIFSNLIGNALLYIDPARPVRIEIGGELKGDWACYFVRDNGLGIPRKATEELFTAFRRFHPSAGRGEGIGLAMVRRMVERHQGRIRVESTVGSGSTFYLELPNTERSL